MKLVVAEKPSVAQSLAAVLGAKEKKDGYLEGGGWLVSLVRGPSGGAGPAGSLWGAVRPNGGMRIFPILPAHWKYDVAKDKKKQLGVSSPFDGG